MGCRGVWVGCRGVQVGCRGVWLSAGWPCNGLWHCGSLQVITPFRKLILCAENRKEMEDWIGALKSVQKWEIHEVGWLWAQGVGPQGLKCQDDGIPGGTVGILGCWNGPKGLRDAGMPEGTSGMPG